MDEVVNFGSEAGLRLALRWERSEPSGTAAEATSGHLEIRVADVPVWREFRWSWVELIEFLSDSWEWLALSDGLPLGLQPSDPGKLLAEAERRWQGVSLSTREEEEEELFGYLELHDVSRALRGAWLPSLVLCREGNRMWASAASASALRPAEEVLGTLEGFGQCIRERLARLDDTRAVDACRAWDHRRDLPVEKKVGIVIGMERSRLKEIQAGTSFRDFWEVAGGRFEASELMAAARMAAALPTPVISSVLRHLRSLPHAGAADLDSLSKDALDHLGAGQPHDQGYSLAQWLRSRPGVVTASGRVNPDQLLRCWKVVVQEADFACPDIDAVACWGSRHGPAVVVNTAGKHGKGRARRATLAHEIAHLLVDRSDSLPVAELFGGRVPARLEARARAFAAELLAPRDPVTKLLLDGHAAGDTPEAAVRFVCRHFGVSGELVAWQARNAEGNLPLPLWTYLRTLVPGQLRWRF